MKYEDSGYASDEYIGCCGDVCSECPRYLATLSNNIEQLKEVADLWFRAGYRSKIIEPTELKCTGCTKDMLCSDEINTCQYLQGNNCGECEKYPCEKINQVFITTQRYSKTCMVDVRKKRSNN